MAYCSNGVTRLGVIWTRRSILITNWNSLLCISLVFQNGSLFASYTLLLSFYVICTNLKTNLLRFGFTNLLYISLLTGPSACVYCKNCYSFLLSFSFFSLIRNVETFHLHQLLLKTWSNSFSENVGEHFFVVVFSLMYQLTVIGIYSDVFFTKSFFFKFHLGKSIE